MKAFIQETWIYLSRIQAFSRKDWVVYVLWIGMMVSLFATVSGFVLLGHANGVAFPKYVWNLPIGIFVFVTAIAIDTIGHRTIYKAELEKGEALVHHITILAGVLSIVFLVMCYDNRELMRIPAYVMAFLSIIYSLIDEGLHWRRYFENKSDRVEMWSHFFIFVGHFLMTASWFYWFEMGYPGADETLSILRGSFLR
jgi:Na+/glutamate symporter